NLQIKIPPERRAGMKNRSLSVRTLLSILVIAVFCLSCAKNDSNDPARFDRSASADQNELPKPYQTESANNPPDVIEPPIGAKLNFPPGFRVNIFADNFAVPRNIVTAPNGDVFVADSMIGQVIVLRDTDHDGIADLREVFAKGLDQPFGIAF